MLVSDNLNLESEKERFEQSTRKGVSEASSLVYAQDDGALAGKTDSM